MHTNRHTFRAPVVAARRADGEERTIAVMVPGVGADTFRLMDLPKPVHADVKAGAGETVDRATAERAAQAFINYRAKKKPGAEWSKPGASVVATVHTFYTLNPARVFP